MQICLCVFINKFVTWQWLTEFRSAILIELLKNISVKKQKKKVHDYKITRFAKRKNWFVAGYE